VAARARAIWSMSSARSGQAVMPAMGINLRERMAIYMVRDLPPEVVCDGGGGESHNDYPGGEEYPGYTVHKGEGYSGAHRIGPFKGRMPLVDVSPAFGVLADADDEGMGEVGKMEGVEYDDGSKSEEICAGGVAQALPADTAWPRPFQPIVARRCFLKIRTTSRTMTRTMNSSIGRVGRTLEATKMVKGQAVRL